MAHPDARLLMLGTPNGGSWAPMQVLSGDDTFGNTLVAFGAPFQDRDARELMAEFPGFLQLQAGLLDTASKLDQHGDLAEAGRRGPASALRERSWWHGLDSSSTPIDVGRAAAGRARPGGRLCAKRLDAQQSRPRRLRRTRCCSSSARRGSRPTGTRSGRRPRLPRRAGRRRRPGDAAERAAARRAHLAARLRPRRPPGRARRVPGVPRAAADTAPPTGSARDPRRATPRPRRRAPMGHVRSRPSRAARSSRPPGGRADVFGGRGDGERTAADAAAQSRRSHHGPQRRSQLRPATR